ncbi:MAG: hypothetical protein CVU54_07885 [Deltaproteobacteria bacterium HGW-Deltaproteobacteria-12]|jgi:thioredoxin-like negative regulator of GroEL|nr:MAG: hypothetical protein CVU54_07885 [Deltaproteobacteria bacterium HGW-Deltaproteobacteria-12]
MDNLIQLITPDNFSEEVIYEKKPVLLFCMPQDDDFSSQIKSITDIARHYGTELKVGYLEEDSIEIFKKRLGFSGTPTYLFFLEGKEINRLLGLTDHTRLEKFVFEIMEQAAGESAETS